jgi:DNA-binding IclR family transcriptional regulator
MAEITSRVLRLLQLFSPARPLWTVEQVASALEVSTSSAYRYVQDLLVTGFLDPVQGGYMLGPALIELDYLIRQHDPLIRAAAPFMRALLEQTTQQGAVILCRRFRDRVMCIHQEHGAEPHPTVGYERGVGMPLFVGATSRVILANEAPRIQRRIYLENEEDIRSKGLVSGWKEFTALAASIRRQGYAESASEVTPNVRGIAAPIFQATKLAAAVSLVVDASVRPDMVSQWRDHVVIAARDLSETLAMAALPIAR